MGSHAVLLLPYIHIIIQNEQKVHARRSVCECGHAFTLKREARITASSPAKCKRALESLEDTLRRQKSNRTRMASMRASETQEQVQEYNIIFVPHLQTDSDRWLYLE